MSEQLMSFEKDIEPCLKPQEAKNLEISVKQPKRKIIQRTPVNIKITKIIK